jgi:hypothetical protein
MAILPIRYLNLIIKNSKEMVGPGKTLRRISFSNVENDIYQIIQRRLIIPAKVNHPTVSCHPSEGWDPE